MESKTEKEGFRPVETALVKARTTGWRGTAALPYFCAT